MSATTTIQQSQEIVITGLQNVLTDLINGIPYGFYQSINELFQALEYKYKLEIHDIYGAVFLAEDQYLNLFDRYEPGIKGLHGIKVASIETALNCIRDLPVIEQTINEVFSSTNSRLQAAEKTFKKS